MAGGWVHLTTAPDQITAEIWVQILNSENVAARIHPADAVSFLGISGHGCRLQVPADDLVRAQVLAAQLELETD